MVSLEGNEEFNALQQVEYFKQGYREMDRQLIKTEQFICEGIKEMVKMQEQILSKQKNKLPQLKSSNETGDFDLQEMQEFINEQ